MVGRGGRDCVPSDGCRSSTTEYPLQDERMGLARRVERRERRDKGGLEKDGEECRRVETHARCEVDLIL
jgi:hypothetical protein